MRRLGGITDPQLRGDGPCKLCGLDPSAGRASISVGDHEWWYCHDEPDPDATSCYEEASRAAFVFTAGSYYGFDDLIRRAGEALGLSEQDLDEMEATARRIGRENTT